MFPVGSTGFPRSLIITICSVGACLIDEQLGRATIQRAMRPMTTGTVRDRFITGRFLLGIVMVVSPDGYGQRSINTGAASRDGAAVLAVSCDTKPYHKIVFSDRAGWTHGRK